MTGARPSGRTLKYRTLRVLLWGDNRALATTPVTVRIDLDRPGPQGP